MEIIDVNRCNRSNINLLPLFGANMSEESWTRVLCLNVASGLVIV